MRIGKGTQGWYWYWGFAILVLGYPNIGGGPTPIPNIGGVPLKTQVFLWFLISEGKVDFPSCGASHRKNIFSKGNALGTNPDPQYWGGPQYWGRIGGGHPNTQYWGGGPPQYQYQPCLPQRRRHAGVLKPSASHSYAQCESTRGTYSPM